MKEKRELDIQIGQQIKKAREEAGYTQEKFAELIGMGAKNVSAIERGVAGVSLSAIIRICKLLFISTDTLLMCNQNDCDAEKLDSLVERLRRLSPQQLDLALDINNKLFEVYSLQVNNAE